MTNDLIYIDNAETGVSETRSMTQDEQAALDAYRQDVKSANEAKAAAEAQAAIDKAALLAKLGLTADEAKLLLS